MRKKRRRVRIKTRERVGSSYEVVVVNKFICTNIQQELPLFYQSELIENIAKN